MSCLSESRSTLKLAIPLIIGQVSQMLLGVADTVMIGKLGVTELAVLTFANSLFYVPFIFGIGMLTPVSVYTANAFGSGDQKGGRRSCKQGMYVAFILGLILFAVMSLLSLDLGIFDQPADVEAQTGSYFRIIMASMVPALMAMVLKSHADSMDKPWPPFWIFFGGVGLNVFLNWVMIYGNLGCAAMGLDGAAWATMISRILILVAMFVWIYRCTEMLNWLPLHWFRLPRLRGIRGFLGIGFPASLQMIAEVAAFSAAGIIMGKLGTVEMAAHQIALMCAATAFMVPLGLSMALNIKIGSAAGALQFERLRTIVISGWGLAAIYSAFGAATFFILGEWLASLYVDEAPVIRLAAAMMMVAGLFQFFDSIQIASVAMLRGLKDVNVPAVMGFFSYWVVGIPTSALLSLKMGYGAVGVWSGLAIGLGTACVLMAPRLWKLTRLRVSS